MGDHGRDGAPIPVSSPVDFRNDARYKRYEAAIEKNLGTFEAISEWADIIAFLARLNKTLTAFPQFPVVPKKLVVCKRLSQCLNPNLPAGVHERTLETYSIIFQKIGIDGLRNDLPIFSFGIFPFFEYASSAIRNDVLDLISRYFIPLGASLRSCLQSLVLALLPGLDEESSDYYQNTLKVFASIAECVEQRAVLEKIWTSMVISSKHRASCLNYLGRVQPRRLTEPEAERFCAGKSALVTTSLTMALDDSQSLVVRGALDIVLAHFSTSAPWLSDDQKIQLVRAALLVLIRRDMSLSRRVFSWLMESLGTTDSTNHLEAIPSTVSVLIIAAVNDMLAAESPNADSLAKPYRVMLHLNDKSAIMRPILDSLVVPMISSLHAFAAENPGQPTERVLISANQVFSVLDLGQIWGNLVKAIVSAETMQQTPESAASIRSKVHSPLSDIVDVVVFGMDQLAICTDEATDRLIPLSMALLAGYLITRPTVSMRTIFEVSRIQLLALDRIQITTQQQINGSPRTASCNFDQEYALSLIAQLPAMRGTEIDLCAVVSFAMLRMFEVVSAAVQQCLSDNEFDSTRALTLMLKVLRRFAERFSQDTATLQSVLLSQECISMIATLQQYMQFSRSIELFDAIVGFLLDVFERLAPLHTIGADDVHPVDYVVQPVVATILECIWHFLTEGQRNFAPIAHILCAIYPHQPVEIDSFFASKIGPAGGEISERALAVTIVTDLWSLAVGHPNCPNSLMANTVTILLEMMLEMTPETSRAATTWFLRSASHLPRITDPLIRMLTDAVKAITEPAMTFVPFYVRPFNADQICYCFRQLYNMLDNGGPAIIEALNALSIGSDLTAEVMENLPSRFLLGISDARDVQIVWAIMCICTPFALAEGTEPNNELLRRQIESIQIAALNLLGIVLDSYAAPRMAHLHAVYGLLIDKLQFTLQINTLDEQPLVVRTIDRLLQKIVSLRSQDPNVGTMVDPDILSRIVSEVFRRPREPAVLRAWSDFLCIAPVYFDDAFMRVVGPQCQIIVQRVHNMALSYLSGSGTEAHLEEAIIELSSFLCDIFFMALGPHSETVARALSRSGSMPTLRAGAGSRADMVQMTSFAPVQPRDVRLNHVTQVIPLFLHEVGILLNARSEDDELLFYNQAALVSICERIYQRNSTTVLYLIVEHLGVRMEIAGDAQLIYETPISVLLDVHKGPMRGDILRSLSSLSRSVRDARGDAFAKLSFEALALALFYACSTSGADELDGAEMLSALLPMTRDVISSSPKFRSCAYIVLASYVAIFSGPLSHLTADRRRAMREHNDALLRLIETCVTLASKSNDLSLWMPSTPDPSGPSIRDDILTDSFITTRSKDKSSARALATLLWRLIPMIETVVSEPDRITTIVALMLNQLVIPNLKPSYRYHIPGLMALLLVRQLASQRSLVRFWRKDFWESVFMDAQFFVCSQETFHACMGNMKEILSTESSGTDRFAEVIQRILSSTSSNLFLSREMDALNRAVMIRRLSVLVFCADAAQIKAALPGIQEKIVDVLKLGTGIASAEVYFLLRILFYRLGEELPMTLWPVIITDLVSLYKSILSIGGVSGTLLATIVQASRLVDEVMISGCATPMLYLWVLFRSVDAIETLDAHSADLFTRIGDKLGLSNDNPSADVLECVRLRRPLVPSGPIASLSDLSAFFRHISLRLDRAESFVIVRKASQLDKAYEMEFVEPFRAND